jgi:hypothetical protein
VTQNKACFDRDNNGDVCRRDQVAWRPDACGRRRALVAGATEPFGRGRPDSIAWRAKRTTRRV